MTVSNNNKFEESYVLANDIEEKEKLLSTLIGGSQQYFYYNIIHLLNVDPSLNDNKNREKYQKLMKDWTPSLKNSVSNYDAEMQYKQIDLRQRLLSFREDNTKPSALPTTNDMFEELRYLFGLSFSYTQTTNQSSSSSEQSINDQVSTNKTSLNELIVDKKIIMENIIKSNEAYKIDSINPNAYEWVLNNFSLPEQMEKRIVSKLKYPIVEESKLFSLLSSQKTGFGTLGIHNNLTLEQMEKYIEKNPQFLDASYVKLYLEKLIPSNELHDWKTLKSAQEEFYQIAFKFVNTLPMSLNSFKLLIYYHFIKFQLSYGQDDQTLFNKYFELPRDTFYYIEQTDKLNPNISKFNESFIGLKSVTQDDDEKLISTLLKKLFLKESSIKNYQSYFRPSYLNKLLAECKLTSMDSTPEKWIELSGNDHGWIQSLKDRVDIEFLESNKEYYHPDDSVVVKCSIKNVSTLLVKVFEISTLNYYKGENKKIDSNINLDGLVASEELTFDYSELPPIQKSEKSFEFPKLNGKRGIFIIEFIGNGKSSRSMIQKGDLHLVVETSPVGQLIKVIDQDSIKVQKSAVYIDGNTYNSNENGDIKIPFASRSSASTQKDIILISKIGGSDVFASLKNFDHQTEQYSLSGGIFVENASLIQGEKAPIVVRVKLFLGDTQISNNYLEESSLTITSTDNSESPVVNSKEIKPFVLSDKQESVYQYKVQEGLKNLIVRFEAKVRAVSRNNVQETLSFESSFDVNTINNTGQISEFYLERTSPTNYQIRHLGKGGDPFKNLDVSLELVHWLTTDRIYTTLRTDHQGCIQLGALNDIQTVTIHDSQGSFDFPINRPQSFTYPSQIYSKLEDVIRLPYLGTDKSVTRSQVNFFQLGGNGDKNLVVHDLLKKYVNIDHNELVVAGLPVGRYLLILSGSVQSSTTNEILIDVVDGQVREGYLIGPSRIVSYNESNVKGLSFDTNVDSKQHVLNIKLKNHSPSTRVHVLSSFFVPCKRMEESLGSLRNSGSIYQEYSVCPKSLYFNGRALGDEINYILNRKTSKKLLPGNSLKKPTLLVQPWSIGKTTNSTNTLKKAEKYDERERAEEKSYARNRMSKKQATSAYRFPYLEFLSHPTIVLSNLEVAAGGASDTISIDISQLQEAGKYVQIIAVDNDLVYSKDIVVEPIATQTYFKDTKLVRPLDSRLHYKEEKLITAVLPTIDFEILNVDSSKYTVYDSLDKVLSLMKTLNSTSYLQDFSFVAEWEKLSFDKKKEKFSKYTCHELNFFIYKKDKDFFDQVVLPLVQTKGYKTFIDLYLVGDKKKLEIYVIDNNRFNKLNTLEKILLGDLFPEHASSIANLLKQKVDATPIQPSDYDTRYKIALNQLDTDIESLPSDSNDMDDGEGGSSSAGEVHLESMSVNNSLFGRGFSGDMASNKMKKKDTFGGAPPPPQVQCAPMMMMASIAPSPAPPGVNRPAPTMMRSMAPTPIKPISRAYEAAQIYQPIEKTEELAETYYYKQRNSSNQHLVPVNEFWMNYAQHIASGNKQQPFISKYIAFSSSTFTESIMSLAVLDIPFTTKDNSTQSRPKNGKLSIKPSTPCIVFHQELVSGDIKQQADILVTQHFFDPHNQFIYTDGEQEELYISEQFIVGKVYCAMVVVANLSSKQKKLDVLLQIPKGSIAVGPSPFVTSDKSVILSAYSTTRLQYSFYFPEPGTFSHFPAHVSEKQSIIASVSSFTFNVVLKPTIVNQLSWEYIANQGTLESILEYLQKENLNRVEFYHLYHRYNDKKAWEQIIELLKKLKFYESTTWSYSIHHKNCNYLKDYLSEQVSQIQTKSIDAPLLYIDPFESNFASFLEYSPLVNSRTHQIGDERKILNDKLSNQYYNFCNILSFKLNPSDTELLSVVYYLLLQDRFEESVKVMKRIGKNSVVLPKLLQRYSSITDSNTSGTSTSSDTGGENKIESSQSTSDLDLQKDKKRKEKEEKQKEKEEKQKEKEKEKERKQKEKEDKKKEKEELKRKEKEEKKKKEEEKKLLKKKSGSEATSPSVDPITTTLDSPSTTNTETSTSTSTTTEQIKPTSISNDDDDIQHRDDEEDDEDEEDEEDGETLIDVSEFNAPNSLPEMSIQYDYLISYLDFFNPNPMVAAENSKKYENYPVQRWNSLFKDLKTKVDQVTNKDSAEIDYENDIDRERRQNKMASNEPTFDISSESNRTISVNYNNLVDITVSYYVMDIEHLFSTNPFVQQELGHFLYVTPNKKESYLLKEKSGSFSFKLPEEFANSNVVVDVVSAQIHHNITVYSNNLAVHITEKVGQLRVVQKQSKKPIPKTYIKVYSKNKNSAEKVFYKDGYTDIAGYFDYSTVSTMDISNVSSLSILVLSNKYGAVIKEAKPPGF